MFWCWSVFQEGKVFLVHQRGQCQLWSFSAWVSRVEVKDSTKSLMMLLIIWEAFTFGEVYLGSLIFSNSNFLKKVFIPISLWKHCVCMDVSALLELQFHQMPLDVNFLSRVRLLETSFIKLHFQYFLLLCPLWSRILYVGTLFQQLLILEEKRKCWSTEDLWVVYVTSCSFCTPQ